MRIFRRLLAVLSTIALGVAGTAVAGHPAKAETVAELLKKEREACEEALRINTVEAIEEYLRKWPRGDSACRALALNALGQFEPGGPPNTDNGDDPIPGGYGT